MLVVFVYVITCITWVVITLCFLIIYQLRLSNMVFKKRTVQLAVCLVPRVQQTHSSGCPKTK